MPKETGLTYQQRTLEGAVTTYTGVVAFRGPITGAAIGTAQGGTALSDSCWWRIQASTLAVRPRKGDRIVSPTEGTWEVLSDDVVTMATGLRAFCRKVAS